MKPFGCLPAWNAPTTTPGCWTPQEMDSASKSKEEEEEEEEPRSNYERHKTTKAKFVYFNQFASAISIILAAPLSVVTQPQNKICSITKNNNKCPQKISTSEETGDRN